MTAIVRKLSERLCGKRHIEVHAFFITVIYGYQEKRRSFF